MPQEYLSLITCSVTFNDASKSMSQDWSAIVDWVSQAPDSHSLVVSIQNFTLDDFDKPLLELVSAVAGNPNMQKISLSFAKVDYLPITFHTLEMCAQLLDDHSQLDSFLITTPAGKVDLEQLLPSRALKYYRSSSFVPYVFSYDKCQELLTLPIAQTSTVTQLTSRPIGQLYPPSLTQGTPRWLVKQSSDTGALVAPSAVFVCDAKLRFEKIDSAIEHFLIQAFYNVLLKCYGKFYVIDSNSGKCIEFTDTYLRTLQNNIKTSRASELILPHPFKRETTLIIDAAVREKIVRDSILPCLQNERSLYMGNVSILSKYAINYEDIQSFFAALAPSRLQDLELTFYSLQYHEKHLKTIEALPEKLQHCTSLTALRLKYFLERLPASHSDWFRSFAQRFPSLRLLTLDLAQEQNITQLELQLEILMQQGFHLNLIIHRRLPHLNFLPDIQHTLKPKPTHLRVEFSFVKFIAETDYNGLQRLRNATTQLTQLHFNYCSLKHFGNFIEKVKQLIIQDPKALQPKITFHNCNFDMEKSDILNIIKQFSLPISLHEHGLKLTLAPSASSSSASLDTDTAEKPQKIVHSQQRLTGKSLTATKAVHLSREYVLDTFQLNTKEACWQLTSTLPSDLELVKADWVTETLLADRYHTHSDTVHYGHIEEILQPKIPHPLPSYATPEVLLGIHSPQRESLIIQSSDETGQYYVTLKAGVTQDMPVTLSYLMTPQLKPLVTKSALQKAFSRPRPMSQWLLKVTMAVLHTKLSAWDPALQPWIAYLQKMMMLTYLGQLQRTIRYCTIKTPYNDGEAQALALGKIPAMDEFIIRYLPENLTSDERQVLINTANLLIQRRGKCRQLVGMAVFLLRHFDIPSRAFSNDGHVVLEAAEYEKGKDSMLWKWYDLGGGRVDPRITTLTAPPKLSLPEVLTPTVTPPVLPVLSVPSTPPVAPHATLQHQLLQALRTIPQPQVITEAAHIKAMWRLNNPRVIVADEQAVYTLAHSVKQHVPGEVFVIRDLCEWIAATTPAVNGQKPEPGSLAYLLAQPQQPGTVIINTAGFKPHELAQLNSFLDHRHNSMLHCMVTHTADYSLEDTFMARTQRVPQAWQRTSSMIAAADPIFNDEDVLHVNCFGNPVYAQHLLFGGLIFDKQGWNFKPGKLYQAMQQNKRLVLHHLPEDPNLLHALQQVLLSRELIDPLHRCLITAPATGKFGIYRDDTPQPWHWPWPVVVYDQIPAGSATRRIWPLNATNFNDYLAQCRIATGRFTYHAGLLTDYQPDEVIRVSSNLSVLQWQQLIAYTAQHHIYRLRVCLAPGITISPEVPLEHVTVTQPHLLPIPHIPATQQEYEEHYRKNVAAGKACYSVSSATAYDMLEIIRSDPKQGVRRTLGVILEKMLLGEAVAVYGELPPDIADNIQSLLDSPPHFKGQLLDGKLEWIKPPVAAIRKPSKTITTFDPSERFLCITGPTGVGKRHIVREYAKTASKTLYAKQQMLTWLQQGGILHLDKANRDEEGAWECLRDAVLRGVLVWQGVEYELNKNHQIIVTQNPSDYPGCHTHDVFNYFTQLAMPVLSNDELMKIAQHALHDPQHDKDLLEILKRAIENIQRDWPQHPVTPRDILAIIERYKRLLNDTSSEPKLAMAQACIHEWAVLYDKPTAQHHFIQHVYPELLEHQQKRRMDLARQGHYVTRPRLMMLEVIETLIQQRHTLTPHQKRAIMLEGSSGTGKTALLRHLLKLHKVEYSEVNVSSVDKHSLETQFHEAARQGKVLVIDEFNLLEEDQLVLLLSLLESSNLIVFVTQNPLGYLGRHPASAALINRFQKINVADYSIEELTDIAHYQLREYPNDLGVAVAIIFDNLRTLHQQHGWRDINYRFFFQTLDAICAGKLVDIPAIFRYLWEHTQELAPELREYSAERVSVRIAEQLFPKLTPTPIHSPTSASLIAELSKLQLTLAGCMQQQYQLKKQTYSNTITAMQTFFPKTETVTTEHNEIPQKIAEVFGLS